MIVLIQYRYSDILILYENVFINLIPAGNFLNDVREGNS